MVMKAAVDGGTAPVVAADLDGDQWAELGKEYNAWRRGGERSFLFCVDCGWPLHPKVHGLSGTRHFAHHPGTPDTCELRAGGGEGGEHERLKAEIYRAIKRVKGYDADVEVETPNADPHTGRPGRVDVVAFPAAGAGTLTGWEIQLSPMSEGRVLTRQEHRQAWLSRCTWVTQSSPRWAERLPWYRLERPSESTVDLVVAGVVRQVAEGVSKDYESVPAFPAPRMVRYVLRGTPWVEGVGWILDWAGSQRARTKRSRGPRGRAAEWCDREAGLPHFTRRWAEEDWLAWAQGAHERAARGDSLSQLDLSAMARFPVAALLDDEPATRSFGNYDRLQDTLPCVLCGKLVIVSAYPDRPVHHHCDWHWRRNEQCAF